MTCMTGVIVSVDSIFGKMTTCTVISLMLQNILFRPLPIHLGYAGLHSFELPHHALTFSFFLFDLVVIQIEPGPILSTARDNVLTTTQAS